MPEPMGQPQVDAETGTTMPFRPPATISRRDFLQDGADTRFRETIYLLVQSLSRLQYCREVFGRRIDLTPSQFAVLLGTAYRQGSEGVTIRDLARHVALASTHVTTEVGRLIRKGLLEKRPNVRDRRSVLVMLTPAGQRAVNEVAPLIRRVNDLLFEGVSVEELAIMREFASKLLRNGEVAAALLRAEENGNKWPERAESAGSR